MPVLLCPNSENVPERRNAAPAFPDIQLRRAALSGLMVLCSVSVYAHTAPEGNPAKRPITKAYISSSRKSKMRFETERTCRGRHGMLQLIMNLHITANGKTEGKSTLPQYERADTAADLQSPDTDKRSANIATFKTTHNHAAARSAAGRFVVAGLSVLIFLPPNIVYVRNAHFSKFLSIQPMPRRRLFCMKKKINYPDTLCPPFSVTVSGRGEASFCGFKRVIEYSDDRMVLQLCSAVATLAGEGLCLKSYEGGEVVIKGRIDSVSLSDGKEIEKA